MTDIDYKGVPGFANDSVLDSLIETFNARLIQAESREHYVGNLTLTVRLGQEEYLTLPTVRIVVASRKDQLERARATLFASYLLRLSQEQARETFIKAKAWESEEFMAWTKVDIEWKRKRLQMANG